MSANYIVPGSLWGTSVRQLGCLGYSPQMKIPCVATGYILVGLSIIYAVNLKHHLPIVVSHLSP